MLWPVVPRSTCMLLIPLSTCFMRCRLACLSFALANLERTLSSMSRRGPLVSATNLTSLRSSPCLPSFIFFIPYYCCCSVCVAGVWCLAVRAELDLWFSCFLLSRVPLAPEALPRRMHQWVLSMRLALMPDKPTLTKVPDASLMFFASRTVNVSETVGHVQLNAAGLLEGVAHVAFQKPALIRRAAACCFGFFLLWVCFFSFPSDRSGCNNAHDFDQQLLLGSNFKVSLLFFFDETTVLIEAFHVVSGFLCNYALCDPFFFFSRSFHICGQCRLVSCNSQLRKSP